MDNSRRNRHLETDARSSLAHLLESWKPLEIEFPTVDDPTPEPVELVDAVVAKAAGI